MIPASAPPESPEGANSLLVGETGMAVGIVTGASTGVETGSGDEEGEGADTGEGGTFGKGLDDEGASAGVGIPPTGVGMVAGTESTGVENGVVGVAWGDPIGDGTIGLATGVESTGDGDGRMSAGTGEGSVGDGATVNGSGVEAAGDGSKFAGTGETAVGAGITSAGAGLEGTTAGFCTGVATEGSFGEIWAEIQNVCIRQYFCLVNTNLAKKTSAYHASPTTLRCIKVRRTRNALWRQTCVQNSKENLGCGIVNSNHGQQYACVSSELCCR